MRCWLPAYAASLSADSNAEFEVLKDLRAQGVTDYAAFPLVFTDSSIHVATWSTR